MIQVVIAARGGPNAKSRCGLQGGGACLAEAMLSDMLDALRDASGVSRVHLVTPTRSLAQMAAAQGTGVIFQSAPGDLNSAFDLAWDAIAGRDPATAIVYLPGDLPLIGPGDIERLAAAYSPDAMVIAPALADGGTGAVMLAAAAKPALRFGADSFRRHLATAREAGLQPRVVAARGLGFDIDRPADFDAVLAERPAGRTGRFIASLSLAEDAA